jgi:hypothetical protein
MSQQEEYESRLEREESRRQEEIDDDYPPSNEEMEELKRGYVRPPRRYRAKDDSEHFYEPPVFEKEVGR